LVNSSTEFKPFKQPSFKVGDWEPTIQARWGIGRVQVWANACSASLRVALRQAFAMDSPTFYLLPAEDTGGMQGFGGGAASVGVLPRADSVAASRGGGGGRLGGAMSRPGTAKLGKFGSSCNVFGTSKPKFECAAPHDGDEAGCAPQTAMLLNFTACARARGRCLSFVRLVGCTTMQDLSQGGRRQSCQCSDHALQP
jgi:hypothetical protein